MTESTDNKDVQKGIPEDVSKLVDPITQQKCPNKFLLGFAALAVAAYIGVLKNDITDKDNDIKAKTEQITTLTNNNTLLQKAVDQQNEIIADNNKQYNVVTQKRDVVANNLVNQDVAIKKIVNSILKETQPKTCEATVQYLRETAIAIKW